MTAVTTKRSMRRKGSVDEMPLISVVMPVHNGERFLAEAIDSVLQQTYAHFELIIVDDGSTDRTGDILAGYASRDDRIIVCRHPKNLGITATRNHGFRIARGSFLAVMDADDISLPHRLERQLRFLQSHPEIGLVGASVRRIDQCGHRGKVATYPSQPAHVAWAMLFFNPVAHPVTMMRRDAVDASAVYSHDYPVAEDYALMLKVSRSARVTNLDEVLLLYRVWTGNISKRPDLEQHAARAVQHAVRALGQEISEAQAHALQGLSRDRYPTVVSEIRDLAQLLMKLGRVYVEQFARDAADRKAIQQDLALRLWQLGALAVPQSVPLTLSLVGSASRLDSLSALSFGSKVTSHMLRRYAPRAAWGANRRDAAIRQE
jgi:glycosyltransferase involved in cell wall biosynthesis